MISATSRAYKEVEIVKWAEARGILDKATRASQYEKHVEEVGELGRALIENDPVKIKDALGDVYVTIVLLAALSNMSIGDCIDAAYQEIAGRKGKMVDGVFVKDD